MSSLRIYSAVWMAQAAAFAARRLKLGAGSSMPGLLARRVAPHVLGHLAKQIKHGAVIVTGTNGKTTTSSLMSEILENHGLKLIRNSSGANLIAGLATSYLESATLTAKVEGDLAILEVDEATIPVACSEIKPKYMVVTNFFRDQLDRYGELDKTVAFIRKGVNKLPAGSTVILNADDPLVASLGDNPKLKYVYYGISDTKHGSGTGGHIADAKYCPRCGTPFNYQHYFYAHLGHYNCTNCEFGRPNPEILLTDLQQRGMNGSALSLSTPKGQIDFDFNLPGLYNVYNCLAAIALALQLDVPLATLAKTVPRFQPAFGRMEAIDIEGRQVYLALVKNPVGYTEVLRTFFNEEGSKNMLFLLNDNYSDGTDVSWIWDVDFEQIENERNPVRIITSGLRAEDMAVRLKYAGADGLQIISEIEKAFDEALKMTPVGEKLFVLPTYTAMLSLRELISKRGYTRQYWEGKGK